uniref:Uncharacterized protein n=1 Tax=Cacopsylla melanoneura TaxID=428564 RepID=A0A8D8ZSJ6_9HEMI
MLTTLEKWSFLYFSSRICLKKSLTDPQTTGTHLPSTTHISHVSPTSIYLELLFSKLAEIGEHQIKRQLIVRIRKPDTINKQKSDQERSGGYYKIYYSYIYCMAYCLSLDCHSS